MAERPRQNGFRQVQAPAAVRRQGGVERQQPSVVVEADPPLGVEAVPLAGHRHVHGPVEPQPDRPAGERRPQRRDRRIPVRLHLLAAEPAAHAQALDGDLVAVEAEDVGDDLLRLGGVLGAALDEHLAVLVDEREGGVGLEVEVLLPGELELAGEDVRGRLEARVDVAALHVRLAALEALGGDGLGHADERRERVGLDDDRRGPEPGGLQRLPEHPGHRVPVVADLGREQRLVVLDARVVDAGHVRGGEHPDHPRHVERRRRVEPGHHGVGLEDLHGVGVQAVLGAAHQVVGVEGETGDVQRRTLVRDRLPDDGVAGRSERALMRCLPWSARFWWA